MQIIEFESLISDSWIKEKYNEVISLWETFKSNYKEKDATEKIMISVIWALYKTNNIKECISLTNKIIRKVKKGKIQIHYDIFFIKYKILESKLFKQYKILLQYKKLNGEDNNLLSIIPIIEKDIYKRYLIKFDMILVWSYVIIVALDVFFNFELFYFHNLQILFNLFGLILLFYVVLNKKRKKLSLIILKSIFKILC